MIVGAAAKRPVVFALAFLDRKIVDAGNAKPHQAVLVEFPVLVAVAAEPVPAVVMPLVGEAHRDAVVAKGPDFFDQAVVEFAIPLARQECLNGLTALEKFGTVSPPAVGRIRKRDASRVTRVPGVLSHTRLLRGGFGGERRQRWAVHGMSSVDVSARRTR